MPVYRLGSSLVFPPPEEAEEGGLVAVGGNLSPQRLLTAYGMGIFPWYQKRPILWYSPDPRMVLVPAELRVSRRLRRTLRQERFELRFDSAFEEVIRSCARIPRRGSAGTWITPEMIEAYCALFELGFAHSSEAWCEGKLAGAVYGVSLGGGFFGESMFFRVRDASKAALAALVWQIEEWGFELFDCQMHTEHLARLGAREWPRDRFLGVLRASMERPTRRGRWQLAAGLIESRLRDRPADRQTTRR
jgi:leucyl/phenylalanyl-tRNA--protein transferase